MGGGVTRLRLRARQAEQIHAHLRRAYPEEGCGVLLGREEGGTRWVERALPFDNRREDSRHDRYLIAPEQFLTAEQEGREAGLEVVGFFHSHPDHPASPSAFDLEHAWPYYSYLIVSVERGRVVDTRSWRLAADRTRFEPETLEPLPEEAPAGGPASPER
jgi:proteasome lid subunit RPN8/RPN11